MCLPRKILRDRRRKGPAGQRAEYAGILVKAYLPCVEELTPDTGRLT